MATSTKPRTQRQRAATATDDTVEQVPAGTPAMSDAVADDTDHVHSDVSAHHTTAGHPRAAADKATRHNSVEVKLPLLGSVKLPAKDELAFLGGVGALAVVGAIEWPIAVVLGAGHTLAAQRRNKVVREFGEALERA